MKRARIRRPHERSQLSIDREIARVLTETYDSPLDFVELAYPWGEPGELAGFAGPDHWQREFLKDLGDQVRERGFNGVHAVSPIRMAIASGHGIGKSTLVAWIVNWIMSTRPHCQGTVTANTFTQLETKTWAAILRWTRLGITSSWFLTTGTRIYQREHPSTWFCSAQSCREENSEAFAGQHAANSSSFYVFDEASAIPDRIFEVAEGGLTDGEPMMFLFGNPTRNTGKFYRTTYGSEQTRWKARAIDSRTCSLPNQVQIAEWLEDYKEDSDFFRVRVRGLPPLASELQFIDQGRLNLARRRDVHEILPDEPLIAGFDVSGGGAAWNVIRFRRGFDARSRPPIRIYRRGGPRPLSADRNCGGNLGGSPAGPARDSYVCGCGLRFAHCGTAARIGIPECLRDQLRGSVARFTSSKSQGVYVESHERLAVAGRNPRRRTICEPVSRSRLPHQQ